MPRGFGGQSQQRWGDNTVNQNEYMRDIQMLDTSGKVCATGDVRRKGMMLLLAFYDRDTLASEPLLAALQRMQDAYKASGKLTIWGVSPDDPTTTLAYAAEAGASFPILLDHDGYHAMLYGLTTFPTVFLADASGSVQRKINGFREAALQDMSNTIASFAGVEPVDIFASRVAESAPA